MPRIHVLPANIANKIAAGEVVDRPASVVKELVENAIDAQADAITVVVQKSGKELIQVIDNGSGIAAAEMEIAFERHATSKISGMADLDAIITLGFRGEALPSIASVSRLEIKSRTGTAESGTVLSMEGGTVVSRSAAALKTGTTISVKNLFFNTPARRNFLRADSTEFNHILKVLKRVFLAYPEIRFTLIHNGEELYNLPAASREARIAAIMGEKLYEGLLPLQETLPGIELVGYASRPEQTRGTTEHQYLFLNRRPIINRSLAHAIYQGYGNLIDRSRYPQFIVFLDVRPEMVDVNVHPTKMEVRFANEKAIYHLFLSAVRRVVQSEKGLPSANMRSAAIDQQELARQVRNPFQPGMTPTRESGPPETSGDRRDHNYSTQNLAGGTFHMLISTPPQMQEDGGQIDIDYQPLPPKQREMSGNWRSAAARGDQQPPLWQVHGRYIFSQIKSGLVIIDQHAAHERVLYEQLIGYMEAGKNAPAQRLLFPQTIDLPLEDYLIYEEIREWLDKVGFAVNELSGRTLLIEAMPADVKVGNEVRVLLEMIDEYRSSEGDKRPKAEKVAAAFARRNAIRIGDRLGEAEMNALIDQLFQTREPYFAPNGQPIIVTMAITDLEKQFRKP